MKFLLFFFGILALVIQGLTFSVQGTTLAAAPVLTPRAYLPLQLRQADFAYKPAPPFGISDSPSFALVTSPQALSLFQSAGMVFDRTSINWERLEPSETTPDNYDWAYADRVVEPLLAARVEPLVLILNSPAWAASSSCGPLYDNQAMGTLLGALAARYPRVHYWGLYNEVDSGCFGGGTRFQAYAEMMRVAWKALHTANPDAQLVFGMFGFDSFTPETQPPGYPGGCCFDYHFVDNLFAYMQAHPLPAGDRYADIMGFNNYLAYDLGYWEGQYPSALGAGAKAAALREKMHAHGFDFPLLISEMSGWPTFPSAEGVPPETQARQAAQMYVESLSAGVLAVMWWPWSDYPDTNCGVPVNCPVFKYGLVTADQQPKLSYFAVKTLARELDGFTPVTSEITAARADYTFQRGKRIKHVVFARTNTFDNATRSFRFEAHKIRVVSMLGGITTYTDNGTGHITLDVTADPVYVEINP